MQACRYGHWKVVQTLLLFRCNVTKASEDIYELTALDFAARNGHAQCIKFLVADFVPSAPLESLDARAIINVAKNKTKYKTSSLYKFVNKAASNGFAALHMASLKGRFECVQLLLDLHANVSAITSRSGVELMDSIVDETKFNTPLHYAACGGNYKCCQILIARGASRLSRNHNGSLPVDIARKWRHHQLVPLLAPDSNLPIPFFPPSNYLSLPLMSVLNIARESEFRLSAAASSDDDADICAICMKRACSIAAQGCKHELCVKCALHLCSTSNNIPPESSTMQPGSIPCPSCRRGILSFSRLSDSNDSPNVTKLPTKERDVPDASKRRTFLHLLSCCCFNLP